jgi:hypothetical protein
MTLDLHKPKERVDGIISEMQAMATQIGEHEDLAQENATLRAQNDVAKRNVKMAEQEFAECRAAYNKYAQMAAEEAKKHEHLLAENKRLTADNNKLSAERQRILQMFGG